MDRGTWWPIVHEITKRHDWVTNTFLFCSMYQHFIFYDQIIFHCMNIPHFVYPFLSQWTDGLFAGLGYYEWCCRDHSYTSHCVDRVLRYNQKKRKKWRTKTDSQAVSGMHPLLQEWSSGTGGAGIRRERRGAPERPFWPWHSPGRTHQGEGSSPLGPACTTAVPPQPQDTHDILSPPRHPFPCVKVL